MRALFALLVILSSSAGAQVSGGGETGPPYGTDYHDEDYARCEVVISAAGLSADPLLKVSGTKVEIGVHAAWTMRPMPFELENPTDPWQTAKVVSWTLTIGGEPVTLPQPEQLVDEVAKTVRFASTYFTDDATLPIILKGTFKLVKQGQQGPIYSQPIEVTATANVKVYNKGTVLRTFEDWDTTLGAYVVYQNPGTYSYSTAAKLGTKSGHTHLRTNMKHTTTPGTDANGNVAALHEVGSAGGLGAELKTATFFFAMTHGEPPLFRSSFDDAISGTPPSAYDDQLQYSGEVPSYVSRASGIPGYNFVVMYACNCLGTAAPAAFGITSSSMNKAYSGFPRTLWSTTDRKGGTWTLNTHANLLMANLAAYWTISEAITRAHAKYPTIDNTGSEMPMERVGDPFARITGVYINNQSQLEANRSAWYIVF